MAKKTSLIIEMNNGEEIKSRSVSYVNPLASAQELVQFGQAYAALSNDTYNQTIRVDRTECDTEAEKPQVLSQILLSSWNTSTNQRDWPNVINRTTTIDVPFLALSNNNLMMQLKGATAEASKNFPSLPIFSFSSDNWTMVSTNHSMKGDNDNAFVCSFKCTTVEEETFQVTLTLAETDEYQGFYKTFTIHLYNSEA